MLTAYCIGAAQPRDRDQEQQDAEGQLAGTLAPR
jgi:hypothetical protein